MFKNYFKIALRNISRSKFLSAINIMGLATGIACCLLISLYVFHETSYDRFHTKSDRIFRVTMEYAFDGVVNKIAVTGNKVLPAFKNVFPEVENGVRAYPDGAIVKYGNNIFNEKGFVYADSAFFDIFSFKILQGDPRKLLAEPDQVVVSASTAKKYFGNGNAVGKIITVNNEKSMVVTGVVEDCPANSQIKFDMMASFSSLDGDRYKDERWWDASYYTYLLLKTPSSARSLQAKIPAYMKTQDKENGLSGNNYMTFHLEPLKDVHLYSNVDGGFEPGSDYHYIYIFSAIALLVLAIAFANYVNLTTARASKRAMEVGVRKVMGALRGQLFRQFIGESLLIAVAAVCIAILLVKFLLPVFNLLADRQLSFNTLFGPLPVLTLFLLLIILGLFGGFYPAMVLSRFNPVKVLKGNFKSGNSGARLRKTLIVTQFAISVGLIVCTLVIHGQLDYIQHKKLGYDKDHVIIMEYDRFVQDKINTVKSEFLSNPGIKGVTTANQSPAFVPGKYGLKLDGKDMIVTALRTDKDFVKTLGLQLNQGMDFTITDENLSDSPGVARPIIINETGARSLGWTAETAIGKSLEFQGKNSIIKGVVNDFHFTSMHSPVSPFVIFIGSYKNKLIVKLSGSHLSQTLAFLKEKWKTLAPHRPFDYEFLDNQFEKLYSTETRTGELFYSFALLAIGLACLGLLGLAAFTAQQRTREIGIRKTLGASVAGIMILLSKDFIKLVAIAALIAFPAAGWAMNQWLQGFTYRINIGAWIFIAAAVVTLLVALLTISVQVIRAAVANPVKSLRSE